MLEDAGVLLAWSLERLPPAWAEVLKLADAGHSGEILVTRLSDHRLAYLDYEGPVIGGRGVVRCVDRGEFCWITRTAGGACVELAGTRLLGRVALEHAGGDRWRIAATP